MDYLVVFFMHDLYIFIHCMDWTDFRQSRQKISKLIAIKSSDLGGANANQP